MRSPPPIELRDRIFWATNCFPGFFFFDLLKIARTVLARRDCYELGREQRAITVVSKLEVASISILSIFVQIEFD